MNICFVANIDESHATLRALALAEKGHNVTFISGPGVTQVDLDVRLITPRERSTRLGRFLESIRFKLEYLREIRHAKADVYMTVYSSGLGPWLLHASGENPVAAMVIGSDAYHEISDLAEDEVRLTNAYYRNADLLIAESPHMKMLLQSMGVSPDCIRTLTWGIDRQLFSESAELDIRAKYDIKSDAPLVFAPRGFKDIYDPELTIAAFHLLVQSHPDARMIMLGDKQAPSFVNRVLPLCKRLSLEEQIIFPGKIPQKAMPDHYRAASATISTARSDGAPNTSFESLFCGTPVIMGKLPNYEGRFTHGENVLLAEFTAEEFARQLRSVLEDAPLSARLVRQGKTLVDAYADNRKNLNRLEGWLKTLVRDAPRHRARLRYIYGLRLLLQPLIRSVRNGFHAPNTENSNIASIRQKPL